MRVRLLGPVDAVDDHGTPLPVPGQRRRSVLAALALRPGEPVSPDKLIDTVWDDPPGTARNTVQAHVAALRRLLGGAASLTYRAPGYVLALEPTGTDVAEAHALAERARRSTEAEERICLLAQARGLWRGTALADVARSGYFDRHREVLDELRAALGEQLFAERLRRGHHREVVTELEGEQVEHPHRETLARLLMVALYRNGRREDALAVHDRLVTALRHDLDARPAAATLRLHTRIRAHDPDLLVPSGLSGARPRPAEVGAIPAPAARQASGLVGRESELASARTLLARSPVVTLVGMGGVGKSTLAASLVAEVRRSGRQAVSVDLTSVPAGRVATAVAGGLGIQVTEDLPPTEVVEELAAALTARDLLVHLDNCEPVVAVAAELVDRVTSVAPSVTFLATSREPLHLLAEERLPLECLEVPEPDSAAPEQVPALQLLAARARAADPAWQLTSENLPALVEICRAVEGLPLGLEIVGSRLRSLTAGELSGALAGRLLAWRHLGRTVDPRHRSLGSLVDLSYGLLSEEEAAALDQLSTTHGARLTDVASLCHDDPVTGEELVLRLVDRSLVQRSEREGRSWIRLHEMVRSFAQERLEGAGRLERAQARHARWVCDRVAATGDLLHGPREAEALSLLLDQQADLAAALEHALGADHQLLGELVTHLWWFWFRTGQSGEGLAHVTEALDRHPPGAGARPMLLAAGAYLAWVVDDYGAAEAWAREVLDDPAETNSPAAALALGALARVLGEQGHFAEAAAEASRSTEVYASLGDAWGVAWSRRCRASALVHAGDLAGSVEACEQSRVEFEELGDQWGVAGSWELLARIAERREDPREALRVGRLSLAAHRETCDTSGERYTLQHLAAAAWQLGDLAAARAYAEDALALCERHGYRVGMLLATDLLLDVARSEGDAGRGEVLSSRADGLRELLGTAAQYPDSVARERRARGSGQEAGDPEAGGRSDGDTR